MEAKFSIDDSESILDYYKDELKWNPPFAEILSKYSPDGLKGYLGMRESVQNGHLPKKTRELILQYWIVWMMK